MRRNSANKETVVLAIDPQASKPDIRAQFLHGMSRAAFCVNVVTTDGPAGRAGVTVSAMSSVSADGDNPTLLVCIHHQSKTAAAIVENGVFCLNVLRDDHTDLADHFGGRSKFGDGDKFAQGSWLIADTGAPRLADSVVAFDCRVVASQRVGTHHVFIGSVGSVTVGTGTALIYADRAYGRAQPLAASQAK
jgi:flavin reductase